MTESPNGSLGAPATVFVSYSREDLKRARAIIDVLEQAGYSVWWDGLLAGGERYSRTTTAALDGASAASSMPNTGAALSRRRGRCWRFISAVGLVLLRFLPIAKRLSRAVRITRFESGTSPAVANDSKCKPTDTSLR